MLKKLIVIPVYLAGAGFLLFLFLFMIQEKFIFHPERLPDDHTFDFAYPFEEVYFETEEDARIHALYFTVEAPRGVVLYFHGNAGSLRSWGLVSEDIVPLGYDLLIIDYRQFGKSRGSLSEKALHHDARYVYDSLLEKYAPKDIVLYGRSIGSGIALKLAADVHPGKVILESPFYSFTELAGYHFPMLPVNLILNYKMPSYKWITETRSPVYIIHGSRDEIIPFKSGKKLAQKSQGYPENFFPVENAGHNDLNQFEAYHRALKKTLSKATTK